MRARDGRLGLTSNPPSLASQHQVLRPFWGRAFSSRGIVCFNCSYDLLLVLNTFEHNWKEGFIEPFFVTIWLPPLSYGSMHSFFWGGSLTEKAMGNFIHCLYLGLMQFLKTFITGLFKADPLGDPSGVFRERNAQWAHLGTMVLESLGPDCFQRNLNSDFIFQKYNFL